MLFVVLNLIFNSYSLTNWQVKILSKYSEHSFLNKAIWNLFNLARNFQVILLFKGRI